MHGDLLGQDAPGLLRRNHQLRMDDGAIEISRHGEFDQVQGFIPADQDDAAHDGGSRIVGVIAAAGEVLAFHRTDDDILLGKRGAVQFVHAERGRCAGSGTGPDTGPGIDLFTDDDVHLRLVAGHLHELADDRGDDILLDVIRQGDAGKVGDGKAVAFRNAHLEDISDFVQGEAHDVKPASQVRNGCGREYTYAFHTVGEFPQVTKNPANIQEKGRKTTSLTP